MTDTSDAEVERLTHTEGGHAAAWYFDGDLGKCVAECLTCGEILDRGGSSKHTDEAFKLTHIEETDEGEISGHREGYFCSSDCLGRFVNERL